MNIIKSPTDIICLKFDRDLGLYGGFEGVGPQWYNVLCMIEELIGHELNKNEIINVYITKEIVFHWVIFKYSNNERRYPSEDYRFYYNKSWIHLNSEFVEQYKLQYGFYLKVQAC